MSRASLVLLVLLCGCSFEEFALRNVPESDVPSWRYGYADGCQSARHDAGTRKQLDRDKARFRADDQYRQGWEAGYKDCTERAQQEALASPTPEPPEETTPTATSTRPPTPEPTAAPTFASPAEKAAARRSQIESRIRELRGELQSLEAELGTLPR